MNKEEWIHLCVGACVGCRPALSKDGDGRWTLVRCNHRLKKIKDKYTQGI